jgi:hypothetical protein
VEVPYFDVWIHLNSLALWITAVNITTTTTTMAPTKTGGDDLDDGFELDHDLIAESDSEGEGSVIGGEEYEDFMTDDEDKGPTVTGRKRKATGEDLAGVQPVRADAQSEDDGEKDEEARKADKKRRKKEKEKERKARVGLDDAAHASRGVVRSCRY